MPKIRESRPKFWSFAAKMFFEADVILNPKNASPDEALLAITEKLVQKSLFYLLFAIVSPWSDAFASAPWSWCYRLAPNLFSIPNWLLDFVRPLQGASIVFMFLSCAALALIVKLLEPCIRTQLLRVRLKKVEYLPFWSDVACLLIVVQIDKRWQVWNELVFFHVFRTKKFRVRSVDHWNYDLR